MPTCIHQITASHTCHLNAIQDGNRCPKHTDYMLKREQKAGPIKKGGCSIILTNGTRCQTFAREGITICEKHFKLQVKKHAEREKAEEEKADIVRRADIFIGDAVPWRLVTQMLLRELRETSINARIFWQVSLRVCLHQGDTDERFAEFYNEIRYMGVLPYEQETPVEVRELEVLSNDTQNVHTKEVSNQTQKLTDLLLEQSVPKEQPTLKLLVIKFTKLCKIKKLSSLLNVLSDMNLWYEKESCINLDDTLYKRLLDAVVCKIESSPHKVALYKRAFEEASESVGLCCQGHLSRLTNIFSGFDDAFASPVSNRELLQDKMASIAKSTVIQEEKVLNAKNALRELDIPVGEWDAWISAID